MPHLKQTGRTFLWAVALSWLCTGSNPTAPGRLLAQEPPQAAVDIEAALERSSAAEFSETPLEDAIRSLSERHNVPMLIERRALAEANIDLELPITVRIESIPLRSALDLILGPFGLDWEVADELLRISTRPEIAGRFHTRVYPVGRLLETGLTTRDLSQTLVAAVAAGSWEHALGTATVQQLPGALMVRNNYHVHVRVERLLAELHQVLTGDHPEPSPGARRIREELNKAAAADFVDTPLREALNDLAERHEIVVLIDELELAVMNVSPAAPVNLGLTGVSLQSVLNLILEPLGLSTLIEGDALLVTPREVVAASIETRVYDVRPLQDAGYAPADLVRVLGRTLRVPVDGRDRPLEAVHAVAGLIVVEAAPPVHRQVAELLHKLARHAGMETAPPVSVTLREQAEETLRGQLEEKTQFEFIDVPFVEAMDYLEDTHNLHFRYDQTRLERAEIEPDTMITLSLSDVRLRTALDALLRPLGVDWIIDDEVIKVTTRDHADARLQVRLYAVGDLIPAKLPISQLVETLEAGVAPGRWVQMDAGPSITPLRDALIVLQSARNHRAIEELLSELRKRLGKE